MENSVFCQKIHFSQLFWYVSNWKKQGYFFTKFKAVLIFSQRKQIFSTRCRWAAPHCRSDYCWCIRSWKSRARWTAYTCTSNFRPCRAWSTVKFATRQFRINNILKLIHSEIPTVLWLPAALARVAVALDHADLDVVRFGGETGVHSNILASNVAYGSVLLRERNVAVLGLSATALDHYLLALVHIVEGHSNPRYRAVCPRVSLINAKYRNARISKLLWNHVKIGDSWHYRLDCSRALSGKYFRLPRQPRGRLSASGAKIEIKRDFMID